MKKKKRKNGFISIESAEYSYSQSRLFAEYCTLEAGAIITGINRHCNLRYVSWMRVDLSRGIPRIFLLFETLEKRMRAAADLCLSRKHEMKNSTASTKIKLSSDRASYKSAGVKFLRPTFIIRRCNNGPHKFYYLHAY
jgi:hypothetical protein